MPTETGSNETAHTPHLSPLHIQVNGTTPASQMGLPGQTPPRPPGFSSVRASSSLARAGAVPVPGALPSSGWGAVRSGPGSSPLVVRAGGAEGRRAVLATRGSGLTRAAQPLRCAPAARPRSPQTASPAPIAGPAAPAKRSARPKPHPERWSEAGEVGASGPAGQ